MVEVTVRGERLELWPQRAVHWPAARTIWVADLHWGKAPTFRHHGLPVPDGALSADLARLGAVITATRAERVLVLGDLIHGRHGLTPAVVDEAAAWLEACPANLHLVEGNHDRHAPELPASWPIAELGAVFTEGPFRFCHEPPGGEPDDVFSWCGHLHPMVTLGGRRARGRIRLPCFHLTDTWGVLPAFGTFTGGRAVATPGRRYAVAEDRVIPLPGG